MAFLRPVLPILALIVVTLAAQNLTTYMPECVQPCLAQSIGSTSCTGPEDSQCLCNNQQRVGYGTFTCAEQSGACAGNSTEQLRGTMMSAYRQYCSDAKATGNWNSMGGFPAFTSSGTAIGPSATTTPPPTGTPTAVVNDEPSSSGSGGPTSSSLSTGAIAGIAVGGGIAVISTTGGLLLLAFRLGKVYSSRKKDGDAAGTGQQGGAEGGDGGQLTDVTDETAKENEAQLDGIPVSELQTEYTLSGFDPVKELPTQEKPVELPADSSPRYAGYGSPASHDNSWRFRDPHA
ncbi:hypothetical protein F5Y05DRAFT_242905 [Hypoxylon sp. FL0543]|nr:hypothetical protein F5Y05DRAFT_242905 [Hypoxylon sp. FL0543]